MVGQEKKTPESGSSKDEVEKMTIDPSPNERKRRLVDPDDPDTDLPDPKRPNIELDGEMKKRVLLFIANAHQSIRLALMKGRFGESVFDIDLGCQIHNILFTAHQYLRQSASNIKSTLPDKIKGTQYKVNFDGSDYTASNEDIHAVVLYEAKQRGLEYKDFSKSDKTNWYGVAGPWLDFLAGYGLRVKELRLGHDNVTISKDNTGSKQFPVSKYGLERAHHVLLEGVTFPPEKKSSMAQSLGPMTILLAYIRATRGYSEKWRDAAKRALAHIPEIDSILSVIQGKPANEIKGLVKEVANLLLLITGRQATRMFFPPTCFAYMLCDKDKIKGTVLANSELRGPVAADYINASGAGGFAFYNLIASIPWVMRGGFNVETAAQVLFHGVFGTYKEDFGILAAVTNKHGWSTREQMGSMFKGKDKSSVGFRPYPVVRVSKMSASNQSKLLTGSYQQITCVPCFSGERVHKYSTDLFTFLAARVTSVQVGKSIADLTNIVKTTIDELLVKLGQRGVEEIEMTWGTTQWFNASEIKEGKYGAPVAGFCPVESREYFLGRPQ